jgi:general secretion pathway protein H
MMKLPAASCSRRRSAGFTLIELMVVALIIGITLTFVVVSFDRDVDDEVQTEAQRLGSLVTLAAQESVLHYREHALEFGHDSYKFLVLNDDTGWQSLDDDNMLRERKLPKGITLELYLEGNDFDFEDEAEAAADGDEETEQVGNGPRVFMLSSGEMSPFEAELRHEDGEVRFVVKAGITGKVEIEQE